MTCWVIKFWSISRYVSHKHLYCLACQSHECKYSWPPSCRFLGCHLPINIPFLWREMDIQYFGLGPFFRPSVSSTVWFTHCDRKDWEGWCVFNKIIYFSLLNLCIFWLPKESDRLDSRKSGLIPQIITKANDQIIADMKRILNSSSKMQTNSETFQSKSPQCI